MAYAQLHHCFKFLLVCKAMPIFGLSWPLSGQKPEIHRYHHVITVWQHEASVFRVSHVM